MKILIFVLVLQSATISVFSACGEVYLQPEFVLESKNYPYGYAPNADCLFLLKGPPCPAEYKFEFLDFNLEPSQGCIKDRLEVEHLDALCGNREGFKSYFSETGALQLRFKSDRESSGRGFRILIKRSSQCERQNETLAKQDYCCSKVNDERNFLLVSPNYPYSLNKANDCHYEIRKASFNVCRLRIDVQFFYLGDQRFCNENYMEIDGKYFCGCKSDLKLISSFGNGDTKLIRFHTNRNGDLFNSYSGFVLNVVQDECPKRSSSAEDKVEKKNSFRYYNDQKNRVAWPANTQKDFIEKLNLINEKTEIIEERSDKDNYAGGVVKHFYFFDSPNYYDIPRDVEETTYVDTGSYEAVDNEDSNNYFQCLNWNQMQFNDIFNRFGQNLPKCLLLNKPENSNNINTNKNCVELNYLQGYFKSPGYPLFYPANLNLCYRFMKQPGICAIRVQMKDFELENSANCEKDFLLLEAKYRYCGNRLSSSVFTMDLRDKQFEDISFKTDGYRCGRGFAGVYEQIACQEMTYPNPNYPTSTEPPNLIACSRKINQKYFAVEINGNNEDECLVEIQKASTDVCQLELYFENYNIQCPYEALIIKDRNYCDQNSGDSIKLSFTDELILITYKRTSDRNFLKGSRLALRGKQISEECGYPAPERLLVDQRKLNNKDNNKTTIDLVGRIKVTDQSCGGFLVAMKNDKFKDICGVVLNSTTQNLPETFCDLFMSNNETVKCIPIKDNSLYVPYDDKKLQLKIQNVDKIQEIEYQEIDCDN